MTRKRRRPSNAVSHDLVFVYRCRCPKRHTAVHAYQIEVEQCAHGLGWAIIKLRACPLTGGFGGHVDNDVTTFYTVVAEGVVVVEERMLCREGIVTAARHGRPIRGRTATLRRCPEFAQCDGAYFASNPAVMFCRPRRLAVRVLFQFAFGLGTSFRGSVYFWEFHRENFRRKLCTATAGTPRHILIFHDSILFKLRVLEIDGNSADETARAGIGGSCCPMPLRRSPCRP